METLKAIPIETLLKVLKPTLDAILHLLILLGTLDLRLHGSFSKICVWYQVINL